MPVDINSNQWEKAGTRDPIGVQIDSLLRNNKEQAFSIKEIEQYLVENHQNLFPSDLIGDNAVEGARAARQSIIANILRDKYWKTQVTFRYVSEEGDTEAGLYFTSDGTGINPIAEVEGVKDVDPESSFGILASRFRQIEKDINEEVSELDDRIDYLEFRIHEELGAY